MVTIIILLILAGVTLNISLGQNGLFSRAQNAADKYKKAQADEEGMLKELDKQFGNTTNNNPTVTPSVDEKGPNGKPLIKTVTDTNHNNKEVEDRLGNPVVIPGGFRFAGNDNDTVEDGIIIEDDEQNQFVWIPVSNIGEEDKKNNNKPIKREGNEEVEITLGRYTFATTSPGTSHLEQAGEKYTENTPIELHYQETSTQEGHTNGGTGAKNLQAFINSVEKNHGYYIARYEASFGSGTTSIMTNQKPAVKATKKDGDEGVHSNSSATTINVGDLWKYITQEDASKVSQNMYSDGDNEAVYVESDLVNSYAWDTAIVYIQAMGNSNYANANCETNNNKNTLKNTGDTGDEKCHIFDMAGNLAEWTTEYSTYTDNGYGYPCVYRGDNYDYRSSHYTASRYRNGTPYNSGIVGFRPLLYIKQL